MELRQLNYFCAVVQLRTFTKAANHCNVTQSNLSEQIKLLERELNCQLLIRDQNGNHLTQAGEILYESACKILDETQNAKLKLEEFHRKEKKVIILGALPTIMISWLPDFLFYFRQKHSNISIKLTEGGSLSLEKSLYRGECDAIISTSTSNSTYQQIELYKEELIVILPEEQICLAKNGNIELKDLKDLPFILYNSGYQLRDIIIDSCKEHGFSPSIAFEVDHTEAIRHLVHSGHGVGIIPKTTFYSQYHEQEKGYGYSISPAIHRTVSLIYPNTKLLSKPMELLIKTLKENKIFG